VQTPSELGIAYRGGPIADGAGKRYCDDSVRGGKGISGRFLVLLGNDGDPSILIEDNLCAERPLSNEKRVSK
jgi:hypothetical protein